MICVAFFFQILPNLLQVPSTYSYLTRAIHYLTVLYTYLAILDTWTLAKYPPWQVQGRGFEPGLIRYIFSGKYPGA